jgi:hypothetical protein
MTITVSALGLVSILTKPIHFINQCFPPKPTFTEKDYPDLTGKVRSTLKPHNHITG